LKALKTFEASGKPVRSVLSERAGHAGDDEHQAFHHPKQKKAQAFKVNEATSGWPTPPPETKVPLGHLSCGLHQAHDCAEKIAELFQRRIRERSR